VRLDLGAKLVEVLNDARVYRAREVRVLVRDGARLVADAEKDVLEAALAEELVTGAEGDLDHAAKLGELLGGVVLYVRNALRRGS
jgi:hypothetical protein